MAIESIGEQNRRALSVKMKPDQIEAEDDKARLHALAKYNAPRIKQGQKEVRVIDEGIEQSPEFQLLLKSERKLRVYDRLNYVSSQPIPGVTIDKIPVLT